MLGEEGAERLHRVSQRLKGLRLLELNATAKGGGVAEMLYSSIPFLNALGIEAEWKVVQGSKDYYECTKSLHNMIQGMNGAFTPEMKRVYFSTLEQYAGTSLLDNNHDVLVIHDPQPVGLTRYLTKSRETWVWRCHIDVQKSALRANPGLWDFVTGCTRHCDAAIFSAAHHVISGGPSNNFVIPPFIDPFSEKNRELRPDEIDKVLAKYRIDPKIPIIAQIGRFDPWKGIDRTIEVYRLVRKERNCQLILAGGFASDDPEGERVLAKIYDDTRGEGDIHVLHLSLENRLENWREVNALQRAASVIMNPSTREGFGLVITEALWKGKPVIGAEVGAMPMQIVDGDTGYFYRTPHGTAQDVVYLLDNPDAAGKMGERGRARVRERFLLPDRILDFLTALDIITYAA